MPAVTNVVVSPTIHSAEGQGSGQASKARAKKGSLGVFAKLLSGLIRKTRRDEETAPLSGEKTRETGEGLVKLRGVKNESNRKEEGSRITLPGNGSRKTGEASLFPGKEKEKKALVRKDDETDAGPQNPALALEGAPRVPEREAVERSVGVDFSPPADRSAEGEPDRELAQDADRKPRSREAAPETASPAGETAGNGVELLRHAQAAGRQAPVGTEKKEAAQSKSETRAAKKNRERFSLEVQDLRVADAAGLNPLPQDQKNAGGTVPVHETELAVELRGGRGRGEAGETGKEKTASQAFEDILARELHQNLNGDIVRHASVLVRDGGEGTVKLSLKPESLGIVKVRLEMAENKITGHIIVESPEAFRAFEREIHSLEQAFRDSGFDGANLDMSLASSAGGNENGADRQWDRADTDFPAPFPLVSARYDAAAESADDYYEGVSGIIRNGPGLSQVNMLV